MMEHLPPSSEVLFGKLLVDQGLAKSEQIEECLQLQSQLARSGVSPTPKLAELLVSKGYLALEHLKNTIRASSAGPPPAAAGPSGSSSLPPEALDATRDPRALVDQYILVSRLGAGGMGEVWRAWDCELRRWVALKFLKLDRPEDVVRFEREAQTSAKLSHPNIAAVYGVGKKDGAPYLAMKLVEGETLAEHLRCDPKSAAALMREAANAVHYAHEAGVIHRDLKPQNIMVERTGSVGEGPLRVYVMDFGLAKETAIDRSVSGSVVGTPSYMPPEQAQGQSRRVDRRSDVYSLGATLYELLTGEPPFSGENAYEVLRQVVELDPPAPRTIHPKIDADLETIVLRCLEKDPERRYPTALALAQDLERYTQGEAVLARPPSVTYRLRKRILKHKALSLALAGTATTMITAAMVILSGSAERGKEREASQIARRAIEGSKEAETLRRIRSSSPAQWEARFAQALEKADEAVQRFPTIAIGHYARGEVLRALGRFRDAVLAFDRALVIDPSLEEAWYRRGICHLELYNHLISAPSLEDLAGRKGALARTREPELEAEKARALSDLGRYALLRRVRDDQALHSRYARAAFAYAEGRYKEAQSSAQEMIAQDPTDERFWLLKANAEDAEKKYDLARATLDRLISDVMPQLAEGHRLRALVQTHQENWKEALGSAGEAIRLDPRLSWAYVLRGKIRGKMEDWEGEIQDLSQAIMLNPGLATAYLHRAQAKVHRKDWEGAVGDFTRALEIDPGVGWVWADRGNVRGDRLKDYPGALADYTKAIELDAKISWVWGNRGKTKKYLGDLKGAVEDLSRGVELSPDEPESAWIYIDRGAVKRGLGDAVGAACDLEKAVASTTIKRSSGRTRRTGRELSPNPLGPWLFIHGRPVPSPCGRRPRADWGM
jgi:serine/threonine protein kinase/regulator of sirC expression with transglutaminase-like and TPR domain